MLGAFEPNSKPWGMDGIPEDFEFDSLPEDIDHFEPILEKAINRLPILAEAGIQTFFNGPESFTSDNRYLMRRRKSKISLLRPGLIRSAFNPLVGLVWLLRNGWIKATPRWIYGMLIFAG